MVTLRPGECEHKSNEDHMICTECGRCSESLCPHDVCADCRAWACTDDDPSDECGKAGLGTGE